jgi:hypothetical protein
MGTVAGKPADRPSPGRIFRGPKRSETGKCRGCESGGKRIEMVPIQVAAIRGTNRGRPRVGPSESKGGSAAKTGPFDPTRVFWGGAGNYV